MTPDEIAEARRIIEAATPGPWNAEDGFIVLSEPELIECPGSGGAMSYTSVVARLHWRGTPEWEANEKLIAAARTGWPKALDEIERLRAFTEQLYAKMMCMCGDYANHSAMASGHSPVSMYDYALDNAEAARDDAVKLLWETRPAVVAELLASESAGTVLARIDAFLAKHPVNP